MALPDTASLQAGTIIVFADITDHAPAAANNLGARTDQIDLTSVADAAARESDKVDLGATWSALYAVDAAFEIAATPTAGNTIDLYWCGSASASAATDNKGGVTGSDGAYSGTAGSTVAESVKQLIFIGSFICTDDATGTVQTGEIGCFMPKQRYGSLVVVNNSGAAMHSDMVESSIRLTPLEDVVED